VTDIWDLQGKGDFPKIMTLRWIMMKDFKGVKVMKTWMLTSVVEGSGMKI